MADLPVMAFSHHAVVPCEPEADNDRCGLAACSKCIRRGDKCIYQDAFTTKTRQSKHKSIGPGSSSPSATPGSLHRQVSSPPPVIVPANILATPQTSAAATPMSFQSLFTPGPSNADRDFDPEQSLITNHGRFAGELSTAIDVRAGMISTATSTAMSHPVPFVDAPLFGPIDLDPPCLISESVARALPSRMDAGRLSDIYFQYIDPVEPVLDPTRFSRDVEAAYSGFGAIPDGERDTRLSIINLVFSLAVQRQESIPHIQRQDEGSLYFKRAWALLRLDIVLWQSTGSIALVQCLILMNRYLNCTSHQQKSWMTSGLANRIAQSICCHHPGPSDPESASDIELKRQVWASCVALDRCIAWSQGRTTAQFLTPLPNRAKLSTSISSSSQDSTRAAHLRRVFELHEIGNQIQLAQTQVRNRVASSLGLPRLYQQDEYHAVAVQLDACLNKWESALPDDWKVPNLRVLGDRKSRVERYLLHLRLLHTKIFMHRPLLARFYSMKSHMAATPPSAKASSLSDRLFRDCASLCIDSAQAVVGLIIETLEPGESLGLLPWWYRVYYLHIAGTTFLAAMLTQELYTDSVAQSWGSVISGLKQHEHLSAYVQQCICTFETLAARILESRNSGATDHWSTQLDDNSFGFVIDDLFCDAGFDLDGFAFAADDVVQF
ncbi:fungal-specific transcription factor [Apiospora hydei]|uniref:Fungal-specific transcription factor n=1 Tax=Apiospora hydei TaxID=1337664 RepID=A0ABR1VW47_9PEZI